MKRILILFILFVMIFGDKSFAQSPTQSSLPTSEGQDKINEKVDELKDKIASRVAQLNLVEKRGLVGTVENVSGIQIIINDLNNKRRIIDVDEFTKFSTDDEDSGISDIKKGDMISVLGLYNKESQRLLARFVNEVTIPLFMIGVVSKKDEDNFTVSILNEDGKEFLADIEKITKSFSYENGEIENSGFTKIELLQNVAIIGFPDTKERNRITVSKIVIFQGIPKNPKIKISDEVESLITPTSP